MQKYAFRENLVLCRINKLDVVSSDFHDVAQGSYLRIVNGRLEAQVESDKLLQHRHPPLTHIT